jgi:hypothetical protein
MRAQGRRARGAGMIFLLVFDREWGYVGTSLALSFRRAPILSPLAAAVTSTLASAMKRRPLREVRHGSSSIASFDARLASNAASADSIR